MIGVNTTYSPVRKPLVAAVVRLRPTVWVIKPKARTIPIKEPNFRSPGFMLRESLGRRTIMASAAIENLVARKSMYGCCSMASFIRTKAAPQTKPTPSRAITARRVLGTPEA
jgi:hypothetical protein